MITGIFSIISICAIVTGGCLSAFRARQPERLVMWASAYLVLIAGLGQLGLVAAWRAVGSPHAGLALAAFILFTIGNACVLLGTVYKTNLKSYAWVVRAGGLLLAVAMGHLLVAVRHARTSWTLSGLIALAIIILISMPIGLFMSSRRQAVPRSPKNNA